MRDARLLANERRRRDDASARRALLNFKKRVDDLDISGTAMVVVLRALQKEIDKLDN